MIVQLKRKYHAQTGSVKCADGVRRGDWYAEQHGINGDHGRRRKRRKNGPKTYDKTQHVLRVLPSGKKRMMHL